MEPAPRTEPTPPTTAASTGGSETTHSDKSGISGAESGGRAAESTAGGAESAESGVPAAWRAGGAESAGSGVPAARRAGGAESGRARGAAEGGLGTVDGEPEELTEVPRLERGRERSPRDMALSLTVLIVPIALLLIFYRVVLSGDAPVTVDPSSTIQEARQAAVFTVVAPQGLGDDWHASSATFRREAAGATLRIGYVDPDNDPVQLVQSSVAASTLLPAELSNSATALGNFRTPDGVWRVYDGRPGERALVLADPTRTIIVVGKTDQASLETLARSLK